MQSRYVCVTSNNVKHWGIQTTQRNRIEGREGGSLYGLELYPSNKQGARETKDKEGATCTGTRHAQVK
jgi:hypothetical protein